ncbi:MAG: glycosyltransferase [Alphaproteobacteria bacterium]|nr:glycosyltransferase [Alphaproteobacteria bacterium]
MIRMQILFLHNNFPAQFGFLGQYLASQGWDVWFGTKRKNSSMSGMRVFNYEPHRSVSDKTHPYAANFESGILNGQAVARSAIKLKPAGLDPDIVVAHSGWGPGLFAKDIWPRAKYVGYFEWYYWPDSPDTVYFGVENRLMDEQLRARMRNAAILGDLVSCDAGIAPTKFQHAQLPECFRGKVHVIHDGVDTGTNCVDRAKKLKLDNLDLTHADEIITYVARGMEPYRGFPEFMKSLQITLKRRPKAHVVIVGEDRVAYGKKLVDGDSWKKRMLKEVDLDLDRIHFTGLLRRSQYLDVLQASSVHVYLTIPFVLSWSMMEAMSAECAIVASDNAPVRELIDDGVHGALVDMKDAENISDSICALLDDKDKRHAYGAAARARILKHYDAKDLMAKRKELFESLV